MISLTENAAEYVKKVRAEANAADKSLRIAVVGGGCSGYQYQIGFDEKNEGDTAYDSQGIGIVVDESSLEVLNGTEVDYVESLEGSSFVFNNPNQAGGCGCGKSFSC